MTDTAPIDVAAKDGLLERLEQGPVICAEGYLFELERRGYLQAGAFVPEVVLEHPELVAQLHRKFVHAGSDVVESAGWGTYGFKAAPIVGTTLAELVATGKTPELIAPFALERFRTDTLVSELAAAAVSH